MLIKVYKRLAKDKTTRTRRFYTELEASIHYHIIPVFQGMKYIECKKLLLYFN
jgi:hypothetical protein